MKNVVIIDFLKVCISLFIFSGYITFKFTSPTLSKVIQLSLLLFVILPKVFFYSYIIFSFFFVVCEANIALWATIYFVE